MISTNQQSAGNRMPQGRMNELAGQSLGGYLLEEELGRGSMGMVYRGKQVALGREVAVKILPQSITQDPSYVARFIREAQIIAGLNHPNIVQIYDAGQQNGVLYFVMEYVQGPTVGSLLQLDGSMPQHLAAEYIAQIADALDAAYKERNVIHRDIKPENLMLDRWGRIKVMDFGLAHTLNLQQITLAQTLVGSIYYASPEQIWGKPLDNRSDIYALGVVLYEMVTGQRPFSGRTLQDLTQTITAGRVLPPTALNPDLSPELEAVILTAMASNRDERFAQASLMAEELRALQLRPPSVGTIYGPEQQTIAGNEKSESSRNLPSKRPQAQIPRHPGIDDLQTLPPHERHTIPVDATDGVEQQPSSMVFLYDTRPEFPAQISVPAQLDSSAQPFLAEQQKRLISTVELPMAASPVWSSQVPASSQGRQRRWRRIHRKFKPSSS
ncbi:MAG TPA: serine/threonine-protein kinase [Ktedonobacteraceae bacterium]|nr:serine/threonine-protein kinase [Ktedonobacteraceae bacterium]